MSISLVHELASLMSYSMYAHEGHAKAEKKKTRKWDGRTPYGIHPVWCAMTILAETSLQEGLRLRGAKTLLLHDILEDTTAGLPWNIEAEVYASVKEMTFESSAEEMETVWERSMETRLLKLYDKTSNLLDASWMSGDELAKYRAYAERLADDVEGNYGLLNIVKLARAIIK